MFQKYLTLLYSSHMKMKTVDKSWRYRRLCFIFIIFIPNGLCSLLSRLKNRYEYVPQQNNAYTLTDDLYDFEFTSIYYPIFDAHSEKKYEKFDAKNENFDVTDGLRKKEFESYDQNVELISDNERHNLWSATPSSHVLAYRPTIHFSLPTTIITIKRRKTWATYFTRKTLPESTGTLKYY